MNKGVLFDLDGTLVDTLEDIRGAINYVLRLTYNREISKSECKSVVGRGLKNALKDALKFSNAYYSEDENQILYSMMMEYYSQHAVDYSKPYDGISSLLSELKAKGVKIGVLSNKADSLVQEIVKKLFPSIEFEFVCGYCDKIALKPAKDGVLAFLESTGCSLDDLSFVGDSEVDGQTITNANIKRGILVTYGFRSRDDLKKLKSDNIILVDSVEELKDELK